MVNDTYIFQRFFFFKKNMVLNRRKTGERLICWNMFDLEHRHLAVAGLKVDTVRYKVLSQKIVSRSVDICD